VTGSEIITHDAQKQCAFHQC